MLEVIYLKHIKEYNYDLFKIFLAIVFIIDLS